MSAYTAADRYMAHHERAMATLRRIEKALQDHMDATNPDECNWGHVGDLSHAAQKLYEVETCLKNETR